MTNKNEQRKVPELRFPEFSEEWEKFKLKDLTTKTGEKNKENFNYPIASINNKIGFSVSGEGNYSNTSADIKEYRKVKKGEFGYNPARVNVGSLGYQNKEEILIVSSLYVIFKINKKLNSLFLYTFLKSNKFNRLVKQNTEGSVREYLFYENFSNISLYIPSVSEQQKIGEFFSKLGRQIELEEKKLALLEEQKKGYMQKIFSQELRFKDENSEEYPEWEDLRLGDIFQEVNDKTSINNEYPILSSTNNGLFSQKDYFKHQVASTNNIGYKILKKNQVVLSPQNLWLGNININFKFEEGIVSPSYKIFNIINSNPLFISYILKRPKMLFEYKNASEQGASIVRRNLNLDLFYNIKLRLPSYEEQTSIQNFLSAIENQIDRSDYKIKMLNLRKNYLLNKIFL